MNVRERAAMYVAKMDGSVSGAGGHNAAFAAACVLVNGFGLSEDEALDVMRSAFNPRCDPAWSERELVHKVAQAAKAAHDKPRGHLVKGEARRDAGYDAGSSSRKSSPPKAEQVAKRQAFDAAALRRMLLPGVEAPVRAFMQRSPVWPQLPLKEFIGKLYRPGEKVLIFLNERSQGQYGVEVMEGGEVRCFRLGNRAGVRPERVDDLPKGGPVGVWMLAQPVDGRWLPNGSRDAAGNEKLSRRSAPNVTAWRFMVLESDEAKEAEWLHLVFTLPLAIAAIYHSGSRSVHVLVEVNAASKAEWDAFRDRVSPFLSKIGADPAAMTAVRLTRAPNVWRYGKAGKDGETVKFAQPGFQQLFYLNPSPECRPVAEMPRRWKMPTVEEI